MLCHPRAVNGAGPGAADDERLHCTGVMRAQAASIFPKNIHLIGTVMHHVAESLGKLVGTYTHMVVHMIGDRSD